MNISYKQIGIIRTSFKEAKGTPIQPVASAESEGTVELFEEYSDGLQDIEGFSHIILIFHMHLVKEPKLKVIPFLDTQERGIFATRSPARPNPIGFSVVKLLKICDNKLIVRNIDIIDNTPLLDIKPFVPAFDVREAERTGWFEKKQLKIQTARDDGRFTE
ncbi:MAG TPA: tRNA (N6-threonylcarbamoyladenosine(37)-N6)-methyltransferase TrmO [Lentisphaeria bacterium]|nr:MAG: tRNA (N6-threonylcarbamoyladenosine(37)-N6)-methyltransferase TrmO [Lentisphaerae bacterium GWF2_38_69]HBM15752.1 tRNA (N6-threonylcarbamoyladenosine(37)-N6)-methyltransferase TrmO [Lentisphaeria bacterium]